MSNRNPIDRTTLGTCPKCHAEIPGADLLIRYERKGQRSVFAHCRTCDHVVRPR